MLAKLVEDLRFVIGAFFAIVSLILLSLGIFDGASDPSGLNLNLRVGVAMALFSLVMITVSVRSLERK